MHINSRLIPGQEINKADNAKKKSKVAPASLGTIFWTAPEVLNGGSPTEASDCMFLVN